MGTTFRTLSNCHISLEWSPDVVVKNIVLELRKLKYAEKHEYCD